MRLQQAQNQLLGQSEGLMVMGSSLVDVRGL
jgi:hypothetical protein